MVLLLMPAWGQIHLLTTVPSRCLLPTSWFCASAAFGTDWSGGSSDGWPTWLNPERYRPAVFNGCVPQACHGSLEYRDSKRCRFIWLCFSNKCLQSVSLPLPQKQNCKSQKSILEAQSDIAMTKTIEVWALREENFCPKPWERKQNISW